MAISAAHRHTDLTADLLSSARRLSAHRFYDSELQLVLLKPSFAHDCLTTDAATGAITVVPTVDIGVSPIVAATDYIRLSPLQDSAGAAYALGAAAGGQGSQVYEWKCTSAGAAAKYAPGSCR